MLKKITSLPALLGLALVCLCGLVALPQPAAAEGTATLAPGDRVLVLPFSCYILDEGYLDAQDSILKTLESNIIYSLQQRGLVAANESSGLKGKARTKKPASRAETYLPLTPASTLSKAPDGSLEASPLEEGQWEEGRPDAYMAAGTPPAQLDDADVVSEGTRLLSPRENAPRPEKGTTLGAPELDDAVIAQAFSESGIIQKAAKEGYDYVLTGSVSYINADIKPSVYHGNRELTSVRSAFSYSYRLLRVDGDDVAASGTASGHSGKIVTLRGGDFGETQINNAVSLVLNQSIQAAAVNMVEQLASAGDQAKAAGADQSDHDYYQDSPGKRLKPAN